MQIYEYFNSNNPKPKCEIEDKLNLKDNKKYFVEEQLGGGGESYVLKIRDGDEHYFALKICKTPNRVIRDKPLENRKFKKEINIAKEFSKDEYKMNFITYYVDGFLTLKCDGKEKNHSYYIMDIADESLEDYLCHNFNWRDEQEVFPKIKELANTINLLHKKDYVHRDIKPQNILIHGELLKLADFGMVEKENTSCTKSGPKYWPTPELLEMCDESIHCSGKSTDVFMLGCIFYFIYTKKYPVGNINIDLINESYKMKPIIKKMISYKQDERYSSANEVYQEIKNIRFE